MADEPEAISLEALKQRAALMGISIAEDKWAQVHPMINRALLPVRQFDTAELQSLEPTVIVRTVPDGTMSDER